MHNQSEYILFTTRIRRINDLLLNTGKNVYNTLGLEIEPNWHIVMLLLEDNDSLSVGEIADKMKISHPAVLKIVKKMKIKGYVKKEQDINDNRKQLIFLSNKAKGELTFLKSKWNTIVEVLSEYISLSLLHKLEKLEIDLRSNAIEKSIYAREKQISDL